MYRALAMTILLAGCAHAPSRAPVAAAPQPPAGAPQVPAAVPRAAFAAPTLQPSSPASAGMSAALTARLDSLILAAIADSAAPGAAVAVGRHGRLVHLRGYGRIDWAADAPAVTDSTLYDMASLTKVIATTTAAMILEEEGRLVLDRPVREYLPEFDDTAKAGITVRTLLTHRSGMDPVHGLYREYRGREQYLEQINLRPPRRPPDTQTSYSDWNMILMQLVAERITGQTLNAFLEERVFGPLGMRDTGYRPAAELKPRIALTEIMEWRGGKVWGEVHDENAWALGGVAGHAGLFASARDLAVFARMMLNGGEYGGVRIVRPETVARWMAAQVPGPGGRALGWEKPYRGSSAGRYLSPWSIGHTGFTGTSIWIDPHADLFVILLTNRVNPTRDNPRLGPLRRAVADLVRESVLDMPLRAWEEEFGQRARPTS